MKNITDPSNTGCCFPAIGGLSICSGTDFRNGSSRYKLNQHIFNPVLVQFKLGLKSFQPGPKFRPIINLIGPNNPSEPLTLKNAAFKNRNVTKACGKGKASRPSSARGITPDPPAAQTLFTFAAQCHRVLLLLAPDLREWRGAAGLCG